MYIHIFYFASMIMYLSPVMEKYDCTQDDWIKYNYISILLSKIGFVINSVIQHPTIYI